MLGKRNTTFTKMAGTHDMRPSNSNMDDQLPVHWSSDLAACHLFSTCFMLYKQGMLLRDTKTNGCSRSMDTFCFDVHWKGSKVRNQCWYFSILRQIINSVAVFGPYSVSGIFIAWLCTIESSNSIWTLTREAQTINKNDCITDCMSSVCISSFDKEWFTDSMSNTRCGYPINSWVGSCSASQSRTVLCCLLCTSAGQRWNRRLIGTMCLWARQPYDVHHYNYTWHLHVLACIQHALINHPTEHVSCTMLVIDCPCALEAKGNVRAAHPNSIAPAGVKWL